MTHLYPQPVYGLRCGRYHNQAFAKPDKGHFHWLSLGASYHAR